MAITDQVITTIIDAVAALNTRVDDLSAQAATPGPLGERGPQGERGEDGRNPSDEEIKAAAAEWLAANIVQPADGEPGPKGDTGERGPPPTETEIALAVAIWFEANADRLRGPRGERGLAGADGVDGRDGVDGARGPTGDTGPSGADGVGIALIEQRDKDSFWITLTDGREYELELPKGRDGRSGGGNIYDIDAYFNSLAFDLTPRPKAGTGLLQWNTVDQTLDLGMEYGVVQQIGQETYARVGNQTGVLIPNGTVVGFAGATDNALLVAPYLADGSQPNLYILGVITHDLPDSGEKGYCCTWGFVRGLNTSAFNVGDILYASPTVPGAFTNIKPTAPDNCIPVAACVVSDATEGMIFVRPTIEQMKYYGVFADTTTQTPATIYTPQTITFNKTEISNGVIVGTPTSRIIVPMSGLYQFSFSAQIESNSSSSKRVWIWPRHNGIDVTDSNTEITISGSGTTLVPAWSWTLSMEAGDRFEMVFAADDTNVQIISKPAATGTIGTINFPRPAVPGMLLEVTQVQQ